MTLCFFICVRNLDEYLTKFIPSKVLEFFPCYIFYSISGQKFKMKELLTKILITPMIAFSFFVAVKIAAFVW